MALPDEVGKQIRAARLARGLTLREAAPRCGVSFQMLGQIEKHGQNTTLERVEAIVQGLEATVQVKIVVMEAEGPELSAEAVPVGRRRAIAERVLAVLPSVPDEEIDVFLHTVGLWERRHGGVDRS
jgi:transcriptional regulator with XRE-family HTH domain